MKKTASNDITIKLPKASDLKKKKNQTLKVAKGVMDRAGNLVMYRTKIKHGNRFIVRNNGRRQWNNIVKVLKGKKLLTKISVPSKNTLQKWRGNQSFTDVQKATECMANVLSL